MLQLPELPPYDDIYLSPHLDDAALSCGGAIAAQVAGGRRVLVVTLCTGVPDPGGPFSDLARAFHRAWGLGPAEVVAARLREDERAMAILGADHLWAGALDAIYRHPQAYNSREALFAEPAPDDPLLADLRALLAGLRGRVPAATIYAPLGVGSHVDHLQTFAAALDCAGDPLRFYEDLPYVARPGELERRLAALSGNWRPVAPVCGVDLALKLGSVAAYASQLAELADSQLGRPAAPGEATAVMAASLTEYAAGVGGERLWVATP